MELLKRNSGWSGHTSKYSSVDCHELRFVGRNKVDAGGDFSRSNNCANCLCDTGNGITCQRSLIYNHCANNNKLQKDIHVALPFVCSFVVQFSILAYHFVAAGQGGDLKEWLFRHLWIVTLSIRFTSYGRLVAHCTIFSSRFILDTHYPFHYCWADLFVLGANSCSGRVTLFSTFFFVFTRIIYSFICFHQF